MFGNNLKKMRLKRGFTQKDVAEFLNISPQSISKWENGESLPSIEFLPKLSEMFSCSIDDFFVRVSKEVFSMECIDRFKTFLGFLDCEKDSVGYVDPFEYVRENNEWIDKCYKILDLVLEEKHISSFMLEEKLGCDADGGQKIIDFLLARKAIYSVPDSKFCVVIKEEVDSVRTLVRIAEVFKEMMEGKTLEEIRNKDF